MRLPKLLLVLLVCATSPAGAAPFESWEAAYNTGDYTTAVRLLRPLAEDGDADAQYTLGVMYDSGQGVRLSKGSAMSWYREAAEQGSAPAQSLLGVIYDAGLRVPQDYDASASWLRRAAEQGDSASQFLLGTKYGLGQGVPRDVVQAHKWLNLAILQLDNIIEASKARESVAKEMTSVQIAEARKLAREWKPKLEQ